MKASISEYMRVTAMKITAKKKKPEISRDDVIEAAMSFATKAFGKKKVDPKKIAQMVNKAIKMTKAKGGGTEDAIGMVESFFHE